MDAIGYDIQRQELVAIQKMKVRNGSRKLQGDVMIRWIAKIVKRMQGEKIGYEILSFYPKEIKIKRLK